MKDNDRSSLVTWMIVIGLLIGSALLSALWPTIRGESPGADGEVGEEVVAAPPVEEEPISLDFIPLEFFEGRTIPPLLAMAILAALVIGPIVVVGGGLAFAYTFLDRQTEATKESEEYQERAAALQKSQEAELREKRQQQPAMPIPDHDRPRWSAISTVLLLIVFAIFLGTAVVDTFIPGGVVQQGDQLINVTGWVVLALVVLVGLAGLALLRPGMMRQAETADNLPIPWDTIWVVVSGMIMIGMGIGVMVILMR